jgi:hypothetical protein
MATKRIRALPFGERRRKRWQMVRGAMQNLGHVRRELPWHEIAGLLVALRSPYKWMRLLSVAKWLHRTHKNRHRGGRARE